MKTNFTVTSFLLAWHLLPSHLLASPSIATVGTASSNGPQITDVKLMNPELSAGDKLDIRATISDANSPINTVSGASAWLGMIVQNLFPNSDSYNRSLSPLQSGVYQVADLQISKYAVPRLSEYVIQEFLVFDMAGNSGSLFVRSPSAQYYTDQNGHITTIPVMKFHLAPNPNAESSGPVFSSLKTADTSYATGSKVKIEFDATDSLSGVRLGCCVGISTEPDVFDQSRLSARVDATSIPGHFQISGLQIRQDLNLTAPVTARITNFSLENGAGNLSFLIQRTPEILKYQTEDGVDTSIPIATFVVSPK